MTCILENRVFMQKNVIFEKKGCQPLIRNLLLGVKYFGAKKGSTKKV
jgi:hypothetical protein